MNARALAIATITLCLLGLSAVAQDLTVTGRALLQSDSTAAVGAVVRLRDTAGETLQGTAASETGDFSLTAARSEVADLYLTYLGALPTTLVIRGGEQARIDLGVIYLRPDDKTLSEVMVQGDLRRIDRTIVFPEVTTLKASPDAMTLLFHMGLSGLSVDLAHKTANIRGKDIYWMIDGVPKSHIDVLQLNPKKVLRVEYSDQPSMRILDKGYGGSVNFILKERTDGGNLFASLSSALMTGMADGKVSSGYHQGKSDFTLDYSGSYRNYPSWQRDQTQTFHLPDQTVERKEEGNPSPFRYFLNDLNLTYTYLAGKGDLFSITWRNNFGTQGYDIQTDNCETGRTPYHRTSVSHYRGYVPVLDAYYKHTFSNGGQLESNLVGTLTRGHNDRDLTDKVGDEVIETISNPVQNRYKSLVGEVSYARLIHPKIYLSTGLQSTYGRASNDYLSSDTHDRLDRSNNYLYGQISGRLSSSTQYSVGTGLKLLYVTDGTERKTYIKNQSSASLYYTAADGLYFALNSYYTPVLPSLSQLSDVTQRFDDLMVYTGDPDLKPATALSNRLTTTFVHGSLTADWDLIYDHTFDPLTSVVRYDTAGEYFVTRPVNGSNYSKAGTALKLRLDRLFGFLTIIGNGRYNHFSSDMGDNPLTLGDFSWDLSLMAQYQDFTLAGYYVSPSRSLYGETKVENGARSGLTAMWSQKRLTLYAQMLWVGIPAGDTYHNEILSKDYCSDQQISIPDNGNMVVVGLTWNFSYGTKAKRTNRSLHNYDRDNSMIKVQD